jgi:hypothetical protein
LSLPPESARIASAALGQATAHSLSSNVSSITMKHDAHRISLE